MANTLAPTPQTKDAIVEPDWKFKAQELEKALNLFPDLYFRLRLDGTIVDYRAGQLADRYRADVEVIGNRAQALLPPDVAALIMDAVQQCHATQSIVSVEYALPMPTRKEHYEARMCPYDDDQVIAVVRNISKRKRAELELAATRRQLAEARYGERRRLAQELHDEVVQRLMGIGYDLDALHGGLEDERWTLEQHIEEATTGLLVVRRQVTAVAVRLRALLGELRPIGLELETLGVALSSYVASLQSEPGAKGVTVQLEVPPTDLPLPDLLKTALLRVAQEAVRNALRHAHAQRIRIQLRYSSDQVVLHIADDGCGFQIPVSLQSFAVANHFGLLGMEERTSEVGGQLTVHSQPGAGTQVTARVPLPPMKETDDGTEARAAGR